MCKDRDFESLPKRKWTISFEKRIEILKHKIVWKIKFANLLVKDLKKSFSRFKNGFTKKNKKEVGKTIFFLVRKSFIFPRKWIPWFVGNQGFSSFLG